MSQALSLKSPMQSIFVKASEKNVGRYAALFIAGIAILTLASKIAIPLIPVPVTLQTLAVLFIGMVYGPRLGMATVASFVALGLMGAPILAAATGTASMGYLIGFIPAAYIAGMLVQRGWGRSMLSTALAAIIGMAVIYVIGLTWLSTIVGFNAAITVGLMPFVFVAIAKIVVLALAVPRFWK